MHKTVAAVAVAVALAVAAPAYAKECVLLIKQLRQANVADPAKAEAVKRLTDEAEQLHKAAKHAESVAKAEEAATIAGLTLQRKKE